jgi:hypothetical protein
MVARGLTGPLLAVLLLTAGRAPGAAPPRPRPAYPEGHWQGGGAADVVVARVVAVADRGATNGNPPRVELRVEEVLRGDPKLDRRQTVWQPVSPFLCLTGAEKAYALWQAAPLAGPRAGDRLIVWGSVEKTKDGPRFVARANNALADTATNRDWAVRTIRATAAYHAAAAAKAAADARAQRQRVQRWQVRTSPEDLRKLARQADFVGVGKIVSGSGPGFQFRVTEILKGKQQRKYADGSYYVGLEVPAGVAGLLDRETEYLLLLSEKGLRAGVPDGYRPAPGSDGVAITDARALAVVRTALGK